MENPTPYHVRESQQRQVREYLSQSHHGARTNSLPNSHAILNSVEPSPVSDLSAAISSNATSPEVCFPCHFYLLCLNVSLMSSKTLSYRDNKGFFITVSCALLVFGGAYCVKHILSINLFLCTLTLIFVYIMFLYPFRTMNFGKISTLILVRIQSLTIFLILV